jgi:hypothetical protein
MKARTRIVLRWVGIVLLAVLIIYTVLNILAQRELRKAYEALAQAGRPIHGRDLRDEAQRQEQTEVNAGPLYEAACLLLRAYPADASLLSILELEPAETGETDFFKQVCETSDLVRYNAENTAALDALRVLAQHPAMLEAMDLIEQALHSKRCDLYSNDKKFRWAVRNYIPKILSAMGRVQALDRDCLKAWELARASLFVADSLEKESSFYSLMARVAQASMGLDTVQWLCDVCPPTAEITRSLIPAIKASESIEPFVEAIDAERISFTEGVFESPWSSAWLRGDSPGLPERLILTAMSLNPLLDADHAAYLDIMREEAQKASQPYTPITEDPPLVERIPFYCVVSRMVTPTAAELRVRYLRSVAKARVTRVGLGVINYCQEHEALPETLEAAGAGDILDPFTEQPLLYESQERGFVISSVGPDQIDARNVSPDGDDEDVDDIIWRWEAPTNN